MMSMVKCPECGNVISKTARTCPQCGHRKKRFLDGCGTLLVIILVIAVVIWLFGGLLLM